MNPVETWRGFTQRRKRIWLALILVVLVILSAFIALAASAPLIYPVLEIPMEIRFRGNEEK